MDETRTPREWTICGGFNGGLHMEFVRAPSQLEPWEVVRVRELLPSAPDQGDGREARQWAEGKPGASGRLAPGWYVVCDGPPGPEAGRFVELETETGKGTSTGGAAQWHRRPDGYWALGPFGPAAGPEAGEAARLRAAIATHRAEIEAAGLVAGVSAADDRRMDLKHAADRELWALAAPDETDDARVHVAFERAQADALFAHMNDSGCGRRDGYTDEDIALVDAAHTVLGDVLSAMPLVETTSKEGR